MKNYLGADKNILIEVSILIIIFVACFFWSIHLASLIPAEVLSKYNVWYGADIPRVFANMTDIASKHYRTKVHPIFSFLLLPPTKILSYLLERDLALAVKVMVAAFSSSTVLFVYLFVRIRTGKISNSTLTAMLFASSSAYIFWSSVPETFPFGAATIALSFLLLLIPKANNIIFVVINFFGLAFSSTNWLAAILVTIQRKGFKRAALIAAIGFGGVVIFAVWQKVFLPSSQLFFLPSAIREEPAYVILPWKDNALYLYFQRVVNFIFYAITSPVPMFEKQIKSSLFQFNAVGWLPLLVWMIIFANGIRHLIKIDNLKTFGFSLILFLLGQLSLHTVYGDEPFLYSAHYVSALLLIASFGFDSGRFRSVTVVFVVAIILNGVNNYQNFLSAIELARVN